MSAAMSFDQLRALAETDEGVVGLVLGGSRGKGAFVDESSDFDSYLIVRGHADVRRLRLSSHRGAPVELVVLTLEEFRGYAAPSSGTEWDCYSFAHVRAELDKLDGEIQRLLDEKGSLAPGEAREVEAGALDAYINSYYRSVKNLERGLLLEAHFDAAESIPFFLTALFALHARLRPYNKYLRWELEQYPLPGDQWSVDRLLPRLRVIVATGEVAEQQALFRSAEALAREHGFGEVVDAWNPDLPRLRGGSSQRDLA